MPWTANNNQAGEIRAPATAAALRQKQQRDADGNNHCRVYAQPLRVVALEELPVDAAALRYCALLHPLDFPAAATDADSATSSSSSNSSERVEFLFPRLHAQFVVAARAHEAVARGHIALSQAQLANLELCVGQEEKWSLFQERVPPAAAVAIEIRPLKPAAGGERVVADAAEFAAAFATGMWQRILTENERVVLRFKDGRDYFARVLEIDAEDESETDFTMPDSFRGVVDEETQVFVTADAADGDAFFQLENAAAFDAATGSLASLRTDVVTVLTNDEEEFPVKKKLLFPCIKLSSAVLSGKGVHKDSSSTVEVDVDCLTFDRVLLYLEHEARNEVGVEFQFDPAYAEDLLAAATKLGCIGLQDVCKQRLGEFDTRVRKEAIRWEEVVRRNTSGEVWLVMLGMVFDVTRWLPEHPGGSVIIPEQAVNVDCTVMFEIYHSSRQSFRYLKQFYIGEIEQADLALVPRSREEPSTAFIEELKQVRVSCVCELFVRVLGARV